MLNLKTYKTFIIGAIIITWFIEITVSVYLAAAIFFISAIFQYILYAKASNYLKKIDPELHTKHQYFLPNLQGNKYLNIESFWHKDIRNHNDRKTRDLAANIRQLVYLGLLILMTMVFLPVLHAMSFS
ncbi:hypothetical protein RCC89_07110 [Cytophagaceae bacterium ABcell3]|nr:hypothetical protein RCC89_07110 [Cytophagaceae bacterium ABcell3]